MTIELRTPTKGVYVVNDPNFVPKKIGLYYYGDNIRIFNAVQQAWIPFEDRHMIGMLARLSSTSGISLYNESSINFSHVTPAVKDRMLSNDVNVFCHSSAIPILQGNRIYGTTLGLNLNKLIILDFLLRWIKYQYNNPYNNFAYQGLDNIRTHYLKTEIDYIIQEWKSNRNISSGRVWVNTLNSYEIIISLDFFPSPTPIEISVDTINIDNFNKLNSFILQHLACFYDYEDLDFTNQNSSSLESLLAQFLESK